jgi:hypothetical protein
MKRFLVAIATIALLTACATTAPAPEPIPPLTVPVVQACPAAQDEARPAPPALPLASITSDSPPASIARAYAVSIEMLRSYARALNSLLDACK